MKQRLMKASSVAALASVSGLALAGGWQAGKTLMINGAAASNNVRVIDGQAYVPVADVARALKMQVVKQGQDLALVRDGGAGQIANDNVGKMGQEVFTGEWRFQVTGIERAASYKKHLTSGYKKEIEAKDGDELVIVKCRVKNGTKVKDELVYDNWDGSNTALTDTEQHSYQPKLWDVRADEQAPDGVNFLPGAAVDFIVVFNVPKGTAPKDLVFTAIRYQYRAKFDQKKHKPVDIRYSLSN